MQINKSVYRVCSLMEFNSKMRTIDFTLRILFESAKILCESDVEKKIGKNFV